MITLSIALLTFDFQRRAGELYVTLYKDTFIKVT
jgi:hypothetical protein